MGKNNLKNSQNNNKIQSESSVQANIGANLGTGIGRLFWMIKYTEEQESGFVWTALIGKTMDVIRVLLPLYLSKVVLSSIYNGHKMEDIFIKTVIVTVSFFLLTVLSGYFQKKAKYHYRRFLKKHQVNKALTVLEMDYGDSERDDVQNELNALKNVEKTVAMGISTFQESLSVLVGNFIYTAIGIYLVRNLFFAPTAKIVPLMNWGLNLGYLGLIFLLHYFAVKIDLKTMNNYAKIAREIYVKNHRYLWQYSELLFDYKVGKDIRFYSEALGKRYNEVYRLRQDEIYNMYFRLFTAARTKRNLISALISLLTALFVGYRSILGCIDFADIFLCIGVLEVLFRGLEEMTTSFGTILSSDSIRKKFIHLFRDKKVWIDSESTEQSSSINQKSNEKADEEYNVVISGEVPTMELRNVSFKYPNSDVLVLKDVSLKLYGNQKLALVGLNGSGKTTLIKLLLGLYKPSAGKILINGEDTANWTADRFVAYFSVVFQDFKLFSLKIGENIAVSEEFDENLVRESLEKTGLSEFYNKYGTGGFLYRDFEEGGIEISGGEAQKIAMSRAIYHGGKFFVLDEPTAALDPLSEYEIYTHFGEITSENPAIYISHRLSSCIFCDVVAVMENGQIVQIGTHEKLLEDSGGVYSTLWNAQAKHYKNQPKEADNILC